MKITVKVPVFKPVCRTPIKPVQAHKKQVGYQRKPKHKGRDYE